MDTALSAPGIVLLSVEPAITVDSVRLPEQFPVVRAILDYAASGHVQVVDATEGAPRA